MGMIMMVMIVPVAVMVMVMPGLAGADALHVVVVALLRETDLGLEAEHLRAVLAELAVHQVLAVENLLHPLGEGVEHRRVVVQVRSEEHTSELQSLMRISYAVF